VPDQRPQDAGSTLSGLGNHTEKALVLNSVEDLALKRRRALGGSMFSGGFGTSWSWTASWAVGWPAARTQPMWSGRFKRWPSTVALLHAASLAPWSGWARHQVWRREAQNLGPQRFFREDQC